MEAMTLISLDEDEYRFIVEYDPERERSASRRDMVAVLEEIQQIVRTSRVHVRDLT